MLTLDEARRRYAVPASRFAEVAGVSLHWIDEGPVDAPAIVLLIGQWLGARQAGQWAAALRDRFRVLRLDLPGQGLAGPFPDGDYSMPAYAAVLAAWLETVTLDRFVHVGTSFSGLVAVLHAAQRPVGLAGLVLANASGLPRPGGSAVAPAIGDGGPRPATFFRDRTAPLLRSIALDDATIEELADLDHLSGRPSEAALRGRAFSSDATVAALARITVPVLLQWSTGSTYLPPEMAERFAAALTGTTATIRMHPGVGHLILIDAPAATAGEVGTFVEGLS